MVSNAKSRTVRQLHKLGFVHKDIKPKNLLLFDGRLCLSDFGLVRNIADTDEHITEMNEPLGPRAIRPPELSGRCGHFLVLAKQPDQGSSCTPTGSCFQGIFLSAFRYTMPDIHSVCQ